MSTIARSPLPSSEQLDSVGVVVLDRRGVLRSANPAAYHLLGPALGGLAGEGVAVALLREDGGALRAGDHPVLRAVRTGRPARGIVFGLRPPGGGAVWIMADVTVGDAQATCTFVDVTSLLVTPASIPATARALSAAPIPMWIQDQATLAVRVANQAACRRYGYAPKVFAAMRVTDLFDDPDEARRFEAAMRSLPAGTRFADRWRHRSQEGEPLYVELVGRVSRSGNALVATVAALDVTREADLERQLLQARKMEAVGRLATGVAHDFNNLLTAISGYSEMLFAGLPPEGELRDWTAQVLQATEQATLLSQQLLSFSRRQAVVPQSLDLNDVVEGVELLLRRVIGEDIDMQTSLRAGIARVRADRGHVQQVLMNLAVNARDAMPAGGRLVIETAEATLNERSHLARPGAYVTLSVADDGEGIDGEVMAHLFEPFFTTKADGRGTGLGLSIVRDIVEQNGGYITVASEPGRGATFVVGLPRTNVPAPVVDAVPTAAIRPPGTECILLAEDHEDVRRLMHTVLESLGYTVIEASDGREALERALAADSPPDLVIADAVMPNVGGPELATRLRQLHPSVRVLFLSGYPDEVLARHGRTAAPLHVLQKPFLPDELARRVREALDAPVADW